VFVGLYGVDEGVDVYTLKAQDGHVLRFKTADEVTFIYGSPFDQAAFHTWLASLQQCKSATNPASGWHAHLLDSLVSLRLKTKRLASPPTILQRLKLALKQRRKRDKFIVGSTSVVHDERLVQSWNAPEASLSPVKRRTTLLGLFGIKNSGDRRAVI
jgi:hypothetical protein